MEKNIIFSELGLEPKEDVVTIDLLGKKVTVRQYLPVQEKLQLMSEVMNYSSDNDVYNFLNPTKMDIFTHLFIIKYYTSIEFAAGEFDDPAKLYDTLQTNNIIDMVVANIPGMEYTHLLEDIEALTTAFYAHRNSIYGILESLSADYSNLNLDAEKIKDKLNDPDNVSFLKDVMTKLG